MDLLECDEEATARGSDASRNLWLENSEFDSSDTERMTLSQY